MMAEVNIFCSEPWASNLYKQVQTWSVFKGMSWIRLQQVAPVIVQSGIW